MIEATVRDAAATSADASFAEIAARRRGKVRRYLHGHPGVMDAVVAVCYLALAGSTIVDAAIADHWPASALLLSLALALFIRRSHPLLLATYAAVVEVAVAVIHPWGVNVSVALWFSLYAVAVRCSRRATYITLAAVTTPLVLLYVMAAEAPMDEEALRQAGENPEIFPLVITLATGATILLSNVIATGIGISVRQRREHEHEIAAWAARTAALGSVNERNRIAREIHDVVAHSLTVMISLSDGAAVVVKKSPDRAGEVLGELSRTGRMALADMRRVLGVLRDDAAAEGAPREPLAPADSLEKLLDGFRTAGLPLQYSHSGPALPEDAAFRLTVYRIVQESLTNVLRYGRSLGRVDVSIERDGGTVTIEVLDDGAGGSAAGTAGAARGAAAPLPQASQGTGQGLAGMRERARIYSGAVEAGPAGNGGWRVHAVLHWNGEPPVQTPGNTYN
ncbi:histidine kinase [Pseudarthrobacter sp. J75]|uniref:sensor histidine kinase n=1 Tax=unclassified Pseudarthrobacter TaxID=2647000 RepID=UPI002E804BA6|nr:MULTISPECIES: histidine kinase [unclassified Pseudarthrobacter]MEE2524433.1 histidine kinase [Pseudarthrobacter sp. J47]MEE2529864.1 histidine kinase [Pseudarthrobacter sp. J75]